MQLSVSVDAQKYATPMRRTVQMPRNQKLSLSPHIYTCIISVSALAIFPPDLVCLFNLKQSSKH